MKDCRLTIEINKPPSEIFKFTLNPKNTPLWIDSIVREESSENPARLGTFFRNVNKEGIWSTYKITKIEENKMFVLTAQDNNYHVRYTLKPIDDNTTELEYYEWVEDGELKDPFTIQILEKLKSVMEIMIK